jgi:hypothetical protein
VTARATYAEAGAAMRATLFAANAADLTVRQHRTLNAVLAFTGSYSKLTDKVYLAQIAAFSYGVEEAKAWQCEKARKDLVALAAAGLIVRQARRGRPPAGTEGPAYVIGMAPKGSPIPARHLEEMQPDCGLTFDREMQPDPGPTSGEKSSPILSEIQPAPGGPTEKVFEENYNAHVEKRLLALAGELEKGENGMSNLASGEWLTDLRELARSYTAAEIERVCLWLLAQTDPVAVTWSQRITGPSDLREFWPQMRAEYLASRGRPRVNAVSSNGDGFEVWWKNYPRKVGKKPAHTAWTTARRTVSVAELTDGLAVWCRHWKAEGTEERFIPYPATWIRGERWGEQPKSAPAEDDTSWMDRSTGAMR